MKTDSRLPLLLLLAAVAFPTLRAETLVLTPDKESRIHADCGSTVHDFVAVVNAPVVAVETGAGPAGLKSATVTVAVAEVKTGDTDRDKDMLKRFNAAAYPTLTYTVKSFETDKAGAVTAKGELVWNGVTKPLDIPVTLKREGDRLAVDATFTVDHRDWGFKKIRSMLMLTVDPVLKFTVKLRGKLDKPAPVAPAAVPAKPAAAPAK